MRLDYDIMLKIWNQVSSMVGGGDGARTYVII